MLTVPQNNFVDMSFCELDATNRNNLFCFTACISVIDMIFLHYNSVHKLDWTVIIWCSDPYYHTSVGRLASCNMSVSVGFRKVREHQQESQ